MKYSDFSEDLVRNTPRALQPLAFTTRKILARLRAPCGAEPRIASLALDIEFCFVSTSRSKSYS